MKSPAQGHVTMLQSLENLRDENPKTITSAHYYCVSGKLNSADKLSLGIEWVKRDTKHSPDPQLRLEWTAREKRT